MNVATVRSVADRHGAKGLRCGPSEPSQMCSIRKGTTEIWLSFENGGLKTTRQGRYYGLTGLELGDPEDLCITLEVK